MCGRFVSPDIAAIELAWHIGAGNSNPFPRRFNVAPTAQIPIIRGDKSFGEPRLAEARWGLVPGWWKQPKPPASCFNARAEDAASKPMWRYSYRHARCLIPAEGWYEWREAERTDEATGEIRKYKQPHFISRPDRRPVALAGLMSIWYPEKESALLTCSIITKAATSSLMDLHDRMPAVLAEPDFGRWLDPNLIDPVEVASMIEGGQADFDHYPVSTRLNAAKNDDAELLNPL